MKDGIYFGNLKGILQKGRWSLNLEEASALVSIYQETDKRSRPDELKIVDDKPVTQAKKKNKTARSKT